MVEVRDVVLKAVHELFVPMGFASPMAVETDAFTTNVIEKLVKKMVFVIVMRNFMRSH